MQSSLSSAVFPLLTVSLAAALALALPVAADNDSADAPGGTLTLTDGQAIEGALEGIADDAVYWKSRFFEQPLAFDKRAISLVQLGEMSDELTFRDPMVVSLIDGGRLYGSLAAINQEGIVVDTGRAGTVTLRRDKVRRLQWLRQGDLLWAGPHGTTGWTPPATPEEGTGWKGMPGGAMRTVGWHQENGLKLNLPPQTEVEFTVNSMDSLRFELALESGDDTGAITTWGNELVLLRGEDFVSLGNYDPDEPLTLRWFWDRHLQRGLVATRQGKVLGQWQADEEKAGIVEETQQGRMIYLTPREKKPVEADPFTADKAKQPGTFTLRNRGASLILTSFKVRQWSGEDPEPRNTTTINGPRVLLAGDRVIPLEKLDRLEVASDRLRLANAGRTAPAQDFSLDEVEEIWLQAAPKEGDPAQRAPGTASLTFADGTWWQGRIQSADAGRIVVSTRYSEQPLETAIADLVAVDFAGNEPSWLENEFPAKDVLTFESLSLNGAWTPASGSRVQWLMPGAKGAVAVTPQIKHTVTRPLDPGQRRLRSALLHLTDGQIVPGQIESITDTGERVTLDSELLGEISFESDNVRALQFPSDKILVDDFNGGGWRISHGDKESVKVTQTPEGVGLTILPGGGYGHSGILLTRQFSFKMAVESRAALRIRMFEGPDAPNAKPIVLAQTSNQIHCGFQSGQRSFSSRGSISVADEDWAQVRLSVNEKETEVYVNDQLVATIEQQLEGDPGRYLGFEMADLWQTGSSKIKIRDFRLDLDHDMSTVPVIRAEARQQALALPRFLRDDPPHHVLLAQNGDLLRGTIESGRRDVLQFRTGLKSHEIPADRVAAAIWLTQPSETAKASSGRQPFRSPPVLQDPFANEDANPLPYTIQLQPGGTMLTRVDSFGPEILEGEVDGIGPCRIPVELIGEIRSGYRILGDRASKFAGWQLEPTPDPLPVAAGQDGRSHPMVGQEAPDFDIPLLNQDAEAAPENFGLAELKGRVVILDFWATWCAICVRSMPEKMEAYGDFDSEKVAFVAVNQAEAEDRVRRFIEARDWSGLQVAMDRDQAVGRSFFVEGLPYTVVIGPDGRVAWVSSGHRSGGSKAIVDVVESLLESQQPDA